MGTEQVSNSASQNDGSSNQAPIFYTKIFEEMCPFYMSIGMAYDEYWRGDCTLTKVYYQAYLQKMERERYQANYNNWLMGAYIYNIVIDLAPIFNPFAKGKIKPYFERPIPITKEEQEEVEQQKRNERLLRLREMLSASAKES